jgi:hypothetical protein
MAIMQPDKFYRAIRLTLEEELRYLKSPFLIGDGRVCTTPYAHGCANARTDGTSLC